MKFEWDKSKNRENVRKHGFDFQDGLNPTKPSPDANNFL